MESESDIWSEETEMAPGVIPLMNPSELGFNCKIAFANVCSIIYKMPNNDESYNHLKMIVNEAKSYMAKKKQMAQMEDLCSAKHTQSAHQHHHQKLQTSMSGSIVSKVPSKGYTSRDLPNGNRSFMSNHHEEPSTSQASKAPSLNESGFLYGPAKKLDIIESEPEPEEEESDFSSDTSSLSDITLGDSSGFLLKNWSVTKDKNNLYLTGTKLDRKGNQLEKEFISKKVLSRPDNHVIRTQCGEYRVDAPLIDPKKCIPSEVMEIFMKENIFFPKQWKKTLALWNDLEKTATKPKRKSDTKNKENVKGPGRNKKTPQADGKNTKKENNKSLEVPEKASDKKKMEDGQQKLPAKENVKGLGKSKKTDGKTGKNQSDKSLEAPEKTANKKKNAPKAAPKAAKNKDKPAPQVSDTSDNELADLADQGSVFEMPSTSLTPNGLFSSIRKTSINGRWTPPTNVFDNIYGNVTTPCSNTSTFDDCFEVAPKNVNVVKRMAKAKMAPAGTKPGQKPNQPKATSSSSAKACLVSDENNDLIEQVLETVKSNPTQTPELFKKVFRSNDDKDDKDISSDEDTF